jgi:phosphate transport system permease protein
MNYGLADFLAKSQKRRKIKDLVARFALALAGAVALAPLISILVYVCQRGFEALNWQFVTELPVPVGEIGGGMSNALLGTFTLVGYASLFGIPAGILVGVYLSEFGREGFGNIVRFCTDLLTSVPSIILGLFVYTLVVVPMKHFSMLAGSTTLAIMMVPMIARSVEEILLLVPDHLREAGLALGLSRWRVIVMLVVRGNIKPITTVAMLSIARISGETAPLLLTAFSNRLWNLDLSQPTASLPVQIYTYAISPFEEWHKQAWSGALLLVMSVFAFNLLTRLVFRSWRGGQT